MRDADRRPVCSSADAPRLAGPGLAADYAAKYCCHATGIVGLATWMKTVALGIFGGRRRCMPTWRGRESPLRRLQGAQEATMLSQPSPPPLERGMTWSTVRLERAPQYWQGQLSRANTARRVIFRGWVSRGIRT